VWCCLKVDRSVMGLVAQQQCVGPLHTPLADVAVVALSHFDRLTACDRIMLCWDWLVQSVMLYEGWSVGDGSCRPAAVRRPTPHTTCRRRRCRVVTLWQVDSLWQDYVVLRLIGTEYDVVWRLIGRWRVLSPSSSASAHSTRHLPTSPLSHCHTLTRYDSRFCFSEVLQLQHIWEILKQVKYLHTRGLHVTGEFCHRLACLNLYMTELILFLIN